MAGSRTEWQRRAANSQAMARLAHFKAGTGPYSAAARAERLIDASEFRGTEWRRRVIDRDAALLEAYVGRERAYELAVAYWLRVWARRDV
jgi:hypothetical protein